MSPPDAPPSTPARERWRDQPGLFKAAHAACIKRLTDGFCSTRNVNACKCWDAAEAVQRATGLSSQAVAWIFDHLQRIEASASTDEPTLAPARALVEKWRRRTEAIQRAIDAGAYSAEGRQIMAGSIGAISTCIQEAADALAALSEADAVEAKEDGAGV